LLPNSEIEHFLQAALLRHLAHADRHEVHRGELARHDGDRLRRLVRGRERIQQQVIERLARIRPERPGRKLHLVLGETRDAEGVVHEHLVVALRHAHRGENRAGRVGADDQIDLVDRDELLVERAREVGLGLVVPHHPFDRPAEQAVAAVDLVDENLADHLVHQAGRGEGSGERERAADADRRSRRRRRCGLDGQGERESAGNGARCEAKDVLDSHSSSSSWIVPVDSLR
jgi:hypothetical protein